jgi:hypothetical protein
MIGNPTKSRFWDQDFCGKIQEETPDNETWRDVILDLCRVGGAHFKAMRFRTTAPPKATKHMKLRCDHTHKHSPCRGRDADGVARTRTAAAYTPMLVKLIVTVGATLGGYTSGMRAQPD